jgi:hypothetical protein
LNFNGLHYIISQEIELFITTAVRISNLISNRPYGVKFQNTIIFSHCRGNFIFKFRLNQTTMIDTVMYKPVAKRFLGNAYRNVSVTTDR